MAAISDLSRLRERWIRLEGQVARLETKIEDADEDEQELLNTKLEKVKNRLATTKILVGYEERRLLNPNSKLVFKPRRLRNSIPGELLAKK